MLAKFSFKLKNRYEKNFCIGKFVVDFSVMRLKFKNLRLKFFFYKKLKIFFRRITVKLKMITKEHTI